MASNPSRQPTRQPTPQQQRVLIARQDHPDKTAAELGKLLGMSGGAVYQAEGRLRDGGHLPSLRARGRKRKRGPGRPRKTTTVAKLTAVPDPPAATEPKTSGANGAVSSAPDAVEKMIAEELDGNQTRIQSIETQQQQLSEELESRQERQARLKRAQTELLA